MIHIFLDLLLNSRLEFLFLVQSLSNLNSDGLSKVWVGVGFLSFKIGDLWSFNEGCVYTFDHLFNFWMSEVIIYDF